MLDVGLGDLAGAQQLGRLEAPGKEIVVVQVVGLEAGVILSAGETGQRALQELIETSEI